MNYRHTFHAGNFADVLKHVVLTRTILYLQRKDAPFRVLDTHAGAGLYDLASSEAERTGEWKDGIGRLLDGPIGGPAVELLAPYLDAVRTLNENDALRLYPGSPKLARMLLRKQDRLSAIELHPADFAALHALFEGDHQVRVTELDGWLTLASHLPPKERRGLVLVDPPFEETGEFDRIVDGLARAARRFAGGVYCLWYPIKAGVPEASFFERLKASGIRRLLRCQLVVRDPRKPGLCGSGMIVVNPPFTLENDLAILLPELTALMGQDRHASWHVDWIAGEHAAA